MPYKENYLSSYKKNFITTIKKNYLLGLLWETFIKKFLCSYKKKFLETIKTFSLKLYKKFFHIFFGLGIV